MLIVSPGPRLDGQLLNVAQIVPAQLPRRVAGSDSGVRALLAEVLRDALGLDAGALAAAVQARATT